MNVHGTLFMKKVQNFYMDLSVTQAPNYKSCSSE